MLIGTAVCGKPHVRWCERAGEIKTSPLYSIFHEREINAVLRVKTGKNLCVRAQRGIDVFLTNF